MTKKLPTAWEYYSKQKGIDLKNLPKFREELREKVGAWEDTKKKVNDEIWQLKDKISKLEDILKSPPGIKGAEYIHREGTYGTGGCGFRTVIFTGTTPQGGLAGGDDTYYCLLCERYTD